MSFAFSYLDATTRPFMLEEIDNDIAANTLYVSDRLNDLGRNLYLSLLREAALFFDEVWLAGQLRTRGCFNASYERKKPKGGFTQAAMPFNAPETLAEGEYNRFYMRGLCRRAIGAGVSQLVVYRAKTVVNARPESEAKLGMLISAEALLNDLRTNPGIDTFLGLPPGPNSGLCVALPADNDALQVA